MRFWLSLGAVLAGAAVAFGAFGAHALKSLPDNDLAMWNTAAQYHMYHALGLVVIGLLQATGKRSALLNVAGIAFLAGLLAFCGSLYGIAASGFRPLGMFAPFGGGAFMLGWVLLAIGASMPARRHPESTER